MIYYITITILFFFAGFYILKPDKVEYKVLSVFVYVFFIILGGFRYEIGADWEAYKNLFEDVQNLKDIFYFRYEPLYTALNYFVKIIFNDFSFFVLVIFFITFSIKFKTIINFSPNIFISLFVYFYTVFLIYDINGLRQGVALALTFYSLKFILTRKLLPFLSLIIIAFFFHKSALIFLPFYWLSSIKLNNKTIKIIFIFTLIFSIPLRVSLEGSNWLNSIFLNDSMEHYSSYLSDDYQKNIPILSFSVIQRVIIFVMFLLSYDKIILPINLKILLRNGYLISIILFILFSFSAELAARLSFYYKTLEILIIPLIVYAPQRRREKILLLLFFTIFSVIGLYRLLSIPDGYLIPYNNLFFS